MSKPNKPAYYLTDAEKRDLIQLIQRGKPLPEQYRFILFEDKREVELVWNGKTREVCTTVLPFQSLEHVDEPRREAPESPQFNLFDTRGRQLKGWTNKLIWGDNKLILSSLKSGALRRQIEEAGGLKPIYIDPPFDVGADFSMDIVIPSSEGTGETFHKEPNLLEQIAYRDTWGRGADSFISMIYERLVLMRDLLAEDGSIYVHCDWRVNSFIRLAMDEIFGNDHLLNHIIWKRTPFAGSSKARANKFPINQDTILSYTRDENYHFNQQYIEYSDEYEERFKYKDERGYYRKTLLKTYSAATEARLKAEDRWIEPVKPGAYPSYKQYLHESKGKQVEDIWTDINLANPMAIERVDYPTQKPEALLERILKASSNESDLVADFFCGSGTTAAVVASLGRIKLRSGHVAEKLRRKWICTDLGKFPIHTTRKRMIQVQRELKDSGKPFRAFEVLNLGRYERQAYLNVGGRLTGKQKEQALAQKERKFRELILRAYRAQPLEDASFFHGKNAARLVVVGPINLPVGRLFVEEVITECRKRGASRVDVLAFEFEMGLFPAVLDEARQKGVDLAPKYIPAEVFDKRAVDKGQVVFHDVSFVEATPCYDKPVPGYERGKDKITLRIELTDFSVYYTQGALDAAAANLKNGKSQVVCEQGQLIKVSKDKEGIVTRENLTRHWTDWVDYWAVDFDYMSRREIIKVAKNLGLDVGCAPRTADDAPTSALVRTAHPTDVEQADFEDRWTGGYIFENEWQSFRTRKNRTLELISAPHTYTQAGRYTVAVKVIDIFGNDTMTLVPVSVG